MLFIGSIISSNWAKETMINDTGFAMLLSGTAIFVLGIFGTAIATLKNRLNQKAACIGIKINNQKVLFRSMWTVGIGVVLTFIGATVGSCYAKETLMNYTGFGMQLAGLALLILGAFETAKISTNIYMNIKRATKLQGVKTDRSFGMRVRNFWRYVVTTHTLYNIAGIMIALSLLLFSLWQLDIIVSGPVWWTDGTAGWHWDGPGAYADASFQCFLWKTTIGQAYDTLFLLIFVSFIVLFVSVFSWRRRTD
ncbi:MAG: hypothetical protein NWE99_08405 [Candidatus Bathyarchaeota archaeon]|nr:hypothetical protein [Candidatus Bathyarchaeota archaeon]